MKMKRKIYLDEQTRDFLIFLLTDALLEPVRFGGGFDVDAWRVCKRLGVDQEVRERLNSMDLG